MFLLRCLPVVLLVSGAPGFAAAQEAPKRAPDVRYEPSSQEIALAMLRLAGVRSSDVVYDLGCGDGRIVIAAFKEFGARAVGIDIDPQRIKESVENARAAGVERQVTFRNEDLFEADFREATVVTLYLWPWVNLKLRPKLLAELRPGTRIVSHSHDMGDWPPEKEIVVEGHRIYLWTIPERRDRPAPPAQ
jgi:SAM-dependent methyltransferase